LPKILGELQIRLLIYDKEEITGSRPLLAVSK
jgi:hypothetical protein